MSANIDRSRWSLFLLWVVLTILSIPIAVVIDLGLMRVLVPIVGDYIYVNGVRHITEDYLYMYMLVPIAGFVTGTLQYWVLRQYLPHMGWWVVTTTAGWIVGACLGLIPGFLNWANPQITMRLAFVALGLAIGVAQWIFLRRRMSRAGWWIAASVTGWGLLAVVPGEQMAGPLEVFLLGMVPASATAATLVCLINHIQSTGSPDA